jgi:ABC-type branched-subunit amino acid transport system substrate-binding protein
MNTSLSRRSNTRRAVAASTCLALMTAVAACGGGDGGGGGPGSQRIDLVIGNVLPLTGPSKALGESGRKASALAVEQIRQAIGEGATDHRVRTVEQDQGKDAGSAVEASKTLVNSDGASCLTGPWSSDEVEQTADDIAIPAKVLEISPVPTNQDVSDLSDHDLVDSTALPESLEGSALAKAIERELGGAQGRTVNVAASNDSYGNTLTQDFIEDWQGNDGTIGAQILLAPPPLNSSQAQQLSSGSPDAVLVIDDLDGFLQFAPALSPSYGWDPKTAWGSDRLVRPGLPRIIGSEVIDGMRALAPGIPEGEEASSAFVQNFKSAEPRDVRPAPFAAQEFDATVLCYLAAVAAGSTDGQKMADELIDITAPGGDQFTWQQLPEAIKALEDGKDIDYTGASGPIDMDVRGNPTRGVFDVYQYVGGRLEVVDEVSVEKPNPAAL